MPTADDDYREQTNRANMNKPASELRCPNPDCRACEAGARAKE